METASHSARRPSLAAATRLRLRSRALPPLVFGAFLAVAGYALLHAGRGTTFFYDDWDFVLGRQEWTPWALLRPHNEHLSVVPVFVYKLTLELFGLDSYGLLRGILAATVIASGVLLYLYARRRVDRWLAVAIACAVVVVAPGWWDLLWGFQIGFGISLAAGLGSLLAIDRHDRAGDLAACALLGIALGSSSLGLPILAAAILEILLSPDRRRRLWIVAVPAVAYLAWYIRYGIPSSKLSNATEIPRWVVDASDDAAGALIAFGPEWGRLVVAGLVLLAIRVLARPGEVSPRLLAVLALPVIFWALTALGRADTPSTPTEGRYLYPGALWLALVAVELASHERLRGRIAAAVAVLIAWCALANLNALDPSGGEIRGYGERTRGALTALDAFPRDAVPYEALPEHNQVQLTAGPYLEARDRYGSSPAFSEAELAARPDEARAAADTATLSLAVTTLTEAPGRPQGCRRLTPAARDQDLAEPLPPEGLVIRARAAPVEVSLKRYAGGYGPLGRGTVAPGTASVLRVPADTLKRQWTAGLRSAEPFGVCPA